MSLKKEIAVIGLGKMGAGIALQLAEKGWRVLGYNRTTTVTDKLAEEGIEPIYSYHEIESRLTTPRVVWLMLPAGLITDAAINQLTGVLSPGDLIIDGANSYFKDTLRRAHEITDAGFRFMDIGVSGGPAGARSGACLMAGGTREDFDNVAELCRDIAAPSAIAYCGRHGAGHFTKMVHNGIEYGMMEAIAEGAATLKYSEFDIDLAEVFRIYNNQSVIESRLVEWTQEAFNEDPELSDISAHIESSGEGEWTVITAEDENVPVPIIKGSYQVRLDSKASGEDTPAGFRNKVVSALREKFGRHQVRKKIDHY